MQRRLPIISVEIKKNSRPLHSNECTSLYPTSAESRAIWGQFARPRPCRCSVLLDTAYDITCGECETYLGVRLLAEPRLVDFWPSLLEFVSRAVALAPASLLSCKPCVPLFSSSASKECSLHLWHHIEHDHLVLSQPKGQRS